MFAPDAAVGVTLKIPRLPSGEVGYTAGLPSRPYNRSEIRAVLLRPSRIDSKVIGPTRPIEVPLKTLFRSATGAIVPEYPRICPGPP